MYQFGLNSHSGFCSSTGSTVYGNGLGMSVTLNDVIFSGSTAGQFSTSIPNSSEFVALFDRYKVESVEFTLIPTVSNTPTVTNAMGTALTTFLPIVQHAVDYDDSVAPSASTDLLQRTDCNFLRLNQPHKLMIKPKYSIPTQIVGGGLPSGGVATSRADWCDTSTDGQSTLWTGIKFWSEALDSSPGKLVGNMLVYVSVVFAFKTPR